MAIRFVSSTSSGVIVLIVSSFCFGTVKVWFCVLVIDVKYLVSET